MVVSFPRRALTFVAALLAAGCGSSSSSSPDAPGIDVSGPADIGAGVDARPLDAGPLDAAAADGPSNDQGGDALDAAASDADRDVAAPAVDASPADAGPPPMPAATCEGGLLVFPGLAEISAYSRPLDRVVVASAYHRMLYIADAEKCAARAVALPRPAQGITVSKDGNRAVVGLDGAIVEVDLQTGVVGTPTQVPGAPQSFVLDDRQGLHFISTPFVAAGQIDERSLGSFNLDTRQWRATYHVRGVGALVPHPAGGVAYWVGLGQDSESVLVDHAAGEAVPKAYLSWSNGQVKTCGQLAFSGDGLRAVTGCGQVYSYAPGSQPTFTTPVTLAGDWAGQARTRSLDFAGGRIAAARYEGYMGPGPDMEVRLWEAATGKLVKAFPTPTLEGQMSRASPERVFLRNDGQRLHALVASGSYGGLRFALASVSEAAPEPPVWPKASSGTYGAGAGEYGLARTLGGTPELERLGTGRPLPWDVGAAAFSRKRGLLAVAPTGTDATVHLVDAESGMDLGALPLTGEITSLTIDEGSDLLAVVRPAGVTLFSLETRMMVRELAIAGVADLAFDSKGRLWLALGTEFQRTFQVVQLSTGEATKVYLMASWLRPHPDGTRFYVGGNDLVQRMTYAGDRFNGTGWAKAADVVGASCAPLAFRGDGLLFMSCARVLALSGTTETDLRAGGSVEGWRSVTHLDVTADRVLGIGGGLEPAPSVSSNGARELRIFKAPLWVIERRFELGGEPGSSPPADNFGKFVFAASSGHRAYVIATPTASGLEKKSSVILTADF